MIDRSPSRAWRVSYSIISLMAQEFQLVKVYEKLLYQWDLSIKDERHTNLLQVIFAFAIGCSFSFSASLWLYVSCSWYQLFMSQSLVSLPRKRSDPVRRAFSRILAALKLERELKVARWFAPPPPTSSIFCFRANLCAARMRKESSSQGNACLAFPPRWIGFSFALAEFFPVLAGSLFAG